MKTATHSERERFVADLIRACPLATASTCQRLMRLGATFARLSEHPQNHRRIKIAARINRTAEQVGAAVIQSTGANRLSLIVKDQVIPIPTS
jgi:hypothetical protein